MIDWQSANQDQHSAINLMNYRLIRLIVFTAAWRGAATHHLHTFTASMARGVATPYTHRRGEYIHYSLGY